VAVNGQQAGPFGVAQLQQMLLQGQFGAQSLVWTQGMGAWAAAATVADLATLFAAAPPPIPPSV